EEEIFGGFSGPADQKRMRSFHTSDWSQRAKLVSEFDDHRLRQLAQRLIYANFPDALEVRTKDRLDKQVAARILGFERKHAPWRTIGDAREELDELREAGKEVSGLEKFLDTIESSAKTQLLEKS